MKNFTIIMIGFVVISFSCAYLIPQSSMNKMAGMKDWSEFGTGHVAIKVLKADAFSSPYGNSCKITWEAKNDTNSTFQNLTLSVLVIGRDRSSSRTAAVFTELRMGGIKNFESALPDNIECALIDHFEIEKIEICSIREGMMPVSVFNVDNALLFPKDGKLVVRRK